MEKKLFSHCAITFKTIGRDNLRRTDHAVVDAAVETGNSGGAGGCVMGAAGAKIMKSR